MKTYSWGVKGLDELTGGIQSGFITLVYGPTGSGKTTLSTYIPVCRIAKDLIEKLGELPEEARFIVMSTDAGYSEERARQIWNLNGLDAEEVERHVVYVEFTEFHEQHDYIKNLEKTIEEKGWKPLLLTLDPAVAIYRGQILRTDLKHRASVIGLLTGKLDLQISILRRLAVIHDCPCFVTSWPPSPIGEAMGGSPPETPVIGGRQMGYLSKIIMELSIPSEGLPDREVLLVKHRSRPVGGKVKFKLCDEGIRE